MGEKSLVEGECSRSITELGGYAYKLRDAIVCPQCGNKIVPPVGRADYFCTLGTYGFMAEVKAATRSLPFRRFTLKQREWAQWYTMDRRGHFYVWLSLGTRVNGRKYPRKTWLIPLRDFLAAESIVAQHRKSIAYKDAVELFGNYELEWQGSGMWGLPKHHPLYPLKDKLDGELS